MSPRLRQVPDANVLAAAALVVTRLGPKATLADVAADAGIAPATLIQRYGSKRGLLVALGRHAFEQAAARFESARAIHASPLEALVSALCDCASDGAADVRTLAAAAGAQAGGDTEWRDVAARQDSEFHRHIRNLLEEAAVWGELRDCDVPALARLLHATYLGSLRLRPLTGDQAADTAVRRDLEQLLSAYRRS